MRGHWIIASVAAATLLGACSAILGIGDVEVTAKSDAGDPGGDEGGDDGGNAVARLVAPLSTSHVSIRTPTLHWRLPAGVNDATLDLCLDRACTKPIDGLSAIPVSGTFYRPSKNLPLGEVFWRLHVANQTSATWEFRVTAADILDTSSGTTLDVNGDGFADVAVAAVTALASSTGRVYVYLGSAAGLADLSDGGSAPATALTSPGGSGTSFGTSIASAGDVNGDGFADLAVGAPSYGGGPGTVYIYFGSPNGLDNVPSLTLAEVEGGEDDGGPGESGFDSAVASAGDVNGDGYADLVVGAPMVGANEGRAYVYLGGSAGLSTTPATRLTSDGSTEIGTSVAGAGDINGDGFSDIIVGAPGTVAGQTFVYYGGPGGIATTPSATLQGTEGYQSDGGGPGNYGFSVAIVGDVDGDGFDDVVVGAELVAATTGHAYIYLGSKTGITTKAAVTLSGPDGPNGLFAASVAGAGDINGDGRADLVVGAPMVSSDVGRAYVYLGNTVPFDLAVDDSLIGRDGNDGEFGRAVASAGDVNGDGFADLVVSASGAQNETGRVYVFGGSKSATGLAPFGDGGATPVTSLTGLDGENASFGSAVFGATN